MTCVDFVMKTRVNEVKANFASQKRCSLLNKGLSILQSLISAPGTMNEFVKVAHKEREAIT